MHKRIEQQKFNAANEKKALKCAFIMSLSDNTAMLQSLEVNASIFHEKRNAEDSLCLYSIEFMCDTLNVATDKQSVHKMKENMFHTLRTLFNLADNDFELTQDDIVASLDKRVKVSNEEKQKLISCRNDHYDSAKRQSTMCLNTLRELKIVSISSRDSCKLNDNALVSALRERIKAA